MPIEQVEQLKQEAFQIVWMNLKEKIDLNDVGLVSKGIYELIDRTIKATLAAVVDAVPEEMKSGYAYAPERMTGKTAFNDCRSQMLENIEKLRTNP